MPRKTQWWVQVGDIRRGPYTTAIKASKVCRILGGGTYIIGQVHDTMEGEAGPSQDAKPAAKPAAKPGKA